MHSSLTSYIAEIDRRIRGIVLEIDGELLSQTERKTLKQIQIACNELKLDVRDYEYAQSRDEQLKWAKVTQHNLKALEARLLSVGTVFGPADIAELSAKIDVIRDGVT